MIYNSVIIGAGAGGMICAIEKAKKSAGVLLIDTHADEMNKLMLTGGGRCNLTNNVSADEFLKNVVSGRKFMKAAAYGFPPAFIMNYFENIGIKLKTEDEGRVFPSSDKAFDLREKLQFQMIKSGLQLMRGRVLDIDKIKDVFSISMQTGETFEAKNILIATGGKSFPKTGSTGDGYEFARKFGHEISPLKAGLVGVETKEDYSQKLMGISLSGVRISLYNGQDKLVFQEDGDIVFTHFGLSGPSILKASLHVDFRKSHKYYITLDLKKDLNPKKLDDAIVKLFDENKNRNIINIIDEIIPRTAAELLLETAEIVSTEKANQITKNQRKRLVDSIKNLRFNIKSLREISKATITSGGVKTLQINPRTMESKLCKGLYFAGEVMDIDAYTGGFNLSIAFMTGFMAANNM